MKRNLQMLFLIVLIVSFTRYLSSEEKGIKDGNQRKSTFNDNGVYGNTSYPQPFNETNNKIDNPVLSTGYYFVDSDEQAPDYWRPNPEILDTLTETSLWRRILAGPRLRNPDYWLTSTDGLRFFRNPGHPSNGDYFNNATDSTDDAIAGPIPIGFSFTFNGLKFDSFYVSTNGIIALTNDRYFYDENKNRIVPSGATDCYKPMSADWFARSRLTGDGLNDAIPDDFGYNNIVCGGDPGNPLASIRTRGGSLDQATFVNNRSAIIAPFFGDLHLSQFDPATNSPADYGKVYFKRSKNADKLIIYFINIAPVRTLNTPYGAYTGNFDLRPGDQNYIAASAQVILNKRDSSVNVVYERFDGVSVVSGRGVPATTIFRYNTTCGVAGFARQVNFGQSDESVYPWAGEYQQYTHYFMKHANSKATYPHNSLAVKFKQWKNTLRVVDIQYRTRKTDPNSDLGYTEVVPTTKVNDYELLAGEERIGAIQPVCLIQNLTNNIQGPQGVNYQPQQLNFRARFRIINQASLRIVYNRLVPIDSACLALPDSLTQDCTGDPYVKLRYSNVSVSAGNYTVTPLSFPGTSKLNGIPPYGFVQVYFPPFEPNEFVVNQIGRLKALIICDPSDPGTNESLGDTWPFDDTLSVQLNVMMRLDEFNDDATSFHIIDNKSLPSTLKWVNIDAEVVSGDVVSNHPLPPRGEFSASNNYQFSFNEPSFRNIKRQSPAILMNRLRLDGSEPVKAPGGDQLRSFPIDMRGRIEAVLTLSLQRSIKKTDWPRGWCDYELVGPEPRTVVNADVFSVWNQYAGSASNLPDEIVVEIAQPSPDGVQFITNIDDKRWRNHPRRRGAKAITNMPAYSLYGAGGYLVGFLESDKDSALSPPSLGILGGLRPDLYDDGIDFEYKKAFIAIPDTFIKATNEGAKNFRFRINMQARNNQKCLTCIPDDDDPVLVDNIKMLFPTEITDVEMSLVKIIWPYTIAPASQATKIPIVFKICNNTSKPAPPFRIRVKIYRQGENDPIYCRTENLPFMTGNVEVEYKMPNWNARQYGGPGNYRIMAFLMFGNPGNPDNDLEPLNDSTWTDFTLRFGDVFAYDPIQQPRNDVPDNLFTGIPGRGLNIFGFATGGYGSVSGPSGGYDEIINGSGYYGGSGSGQIAMKFQLFQPDTIYGYQVFWGTLNQALDDISLAIYTDAGNPGQIIPGSLVYKLRCFDDIRKKPFYDEYVNYKIDKGPVVLPAGTYWMALGQLGETGLELGASKTRVGMRTTSIYVPPPITSVGPVGGAGYHLVINKDFRRKNPSDNLINNNFFAFENTRGSGQWVQFMPTIGNPGYAHLHHYGISPADGYTATLSRGTWIPMIRPYFGPRTWNTVYYWDPCWIEFDPVTMSFFTGRITGNSIELNWGTASEIKNQGFYVLRKVNNDKEWSTISFVKGAGNTLNPQKYIYNDNEISSGNTYHYSLKQIDYDGTFACDPDPLLLTFYYHDNNPGTYLEPCIPNPMTDFTRIKYYINEESNVTLEIIDLLGNIVRTIVSDNSFPGYHEEIWDGTDNNGIPVSNGSYLIKLTNSGRFFTGIVTMNR